MHALGGQGVQATELANAVVRRPPVDIHILNSREQKQWHAIARRVRAWIEALQTDADADLNVVSDAEAPSTLPAFVTNRPAAIVSGG
jgi:hypothetical protein